MEYRRVPRTGLPLSAVGFGTCQLRLVPEQQAIDTLRRGFELGVNVVHTAPDYEGAEDLVAQAVAESGREVVVLTQGYGDAAHFAWLFGEARRRQRRDRLPMYGIACIDDRELLGENVWGPGGQVEFLQEQKRAHRLDGIFCTTHGTPEYLARLVTSGVFDAIMLAYNPLGFHLLSYNPGPTHAFESIPRNRGEIFDLALRHRVALLVMKPLAGGLLSEGRAFPSRGGFADHVARPAAADVLRAVLAEHPAVTCVMPGTSSLAEAEENARAGFGARPDAEARAVVERASAELATTLCSRCGACDTLCSHQLPVSWLFRDAYVNAFPSETFETADALQSLHLQPQDAATCRTCTDVTCACPAGLDIPAGLARAHDFVRAERARGRASRTPAELAADPPRGALGARLVRADVGPGDAGTIGRFWIENAGEVAWKGAPHHAGDERLTMTVTDAGGRTLARASLRHDVPPGTRTHVVLEWTGVTAPDRVRLGAPGILAAEWRVAPAGDGYVFG
jgi:predicted aldo/keto reductase-like oxidoreductase